MKRSRLTPDIVVRIKELIANKISHRQVATLLDVHRSTVSNALRRKKETPSGIIIPRKTADNIVWCVPCSAHVYHPCLACQIKATKSSKKVPHPEDPPDKLALAIPIGMEKIYEAIHGTKDDPKRVGK